MTRTAAAVLVAAALAAAPPVGGQEGERVLAVCGGCHAGLDASRELALGHADSVTCLTCHHVGYTNDPEVAARRRLDVCASCHAEASRNPLHPEEIGEARRCTACHTIHGEDGRAPDAAEACAACHATPHGLHAGAPDGPSCAGCHEPHPVLPAGAPAAATSCTTCHAGTHPSHEGRLGGSEDCVACHALDGSGPASGDAAARAETCADCHALGRVHAPDGAPAPPCTACHAFATDPLLDEAGPVISRRCGSCHPEVLAALEAGGHAAAVDALDPDPALPTCLTCHQVHDAPQLERGARRLAATRACLECHGDPGLIERYRLPHNVTGSFDDDVHGATVRFLLREPDGASEPPVLVCADCHGPHRVGWFQGDSLATVCQGCHTTASGSFSGAWLGHDPVGPRNQLVVWSVRLFYYVLIPFVLGGLAINIAFHLIDQRRRGAHPLKSDGMRRLLARLRGRTVEEEPSVTRFSRLERAEHLASMVTFFLLVVTGLPQTAPRTEIGQWLIALFGGIGTTRLVHRVVGFAFVALLVVHLTRGAAGILRRRRLPDITPSKRDFKDLWGLAKHYVRGHPRPKADRFDASEKFEYWGLVLGGTIMSVTGVVLVFPELVSQVVPGIVVAAMRTMHGLEATFAVLVIVLWHSYGVIFRPEIFPLDTTMFTGKISLERMREEHALEYERRFGRPADEEAGAHGAGD